MMRIDFLYSKHEHCTLTASNGPVIYVLLLSLGSFAKQIYLPCIAASPQVCLPVEVWPLGFFQEVNNRA